MVYEGLSDSELTNLDTFIDRYCQDEVTTLSKQYPSEKQSFVIDYSDLYQATIYEGRNIADVLTDNPDKALDDLQHAVEEYDYPVAIDINPTVRVKGAAYERTVETLRKDDVGKYITVRGQVNQITQVYPKPVVAAFDCEICGNTEELMQNWDNIETPDAQCPACNKKTGWVLNDRQTEFQDHQVIELAALPEDTGGQVSDTIKVNVTNDLAGMVSAGDRIKVSGVLKTEKEDIIRKENADARRPMYLDGKAIQNEQESFAEIEPQRVDEIEALAEEDDIYEQLIESFAPHIHTDAEGDKQKLAIILALFGGVQKQLGTGSQIRGNINVLLIGDGGTAKSQYLKTAEKLAPKSVLASGKGATAAGLTATAEQSNLTGEWTLKAGALVMANNGVACIDEFDKMDASARKSIHEALENQEVPVTKAGINTTLPAKTAVIAAANPVDGEFNRFDSLSEQIDMEQPLVSRFDLIFGLVDEQDPDRDATIARTQHDVAAGESDIEPAIEYDLLREYIAYARQIEPSYASDAVKDRLVDYYVELRQDAEDGDEPGPRLNDSLRRLAQASARVRLSETIEMEDAERAIEFIKYTIGQIALDEEGNISGTEFDGGSQKEEIEGITQYVRENPACTIDDITDGLGMDTQTVEGKIEKLKQQGELYEPQTGEFRVT